MLWLAASVVPGFEVAGLVPAPLGAILLAALNTVAEQTPVLQSVRRGSLTRP
jgi:hypothetical protein